jgi:hypothetical protein
LNVLRRFAAVNFVVVMCKSCANFERAFAADNAGVRRLGTADRTARCTLEKFERVAQSTGFRDPERMRRAASGASAKRTSTSETAF